MQRQPSPQSEQSLAIGADHVRHRLAAYPVPVQPQSPVEREAHALAAARELPGAGLYWQTMRPSVVAGPIGGPTPAKR